MISSPSTLTSSSKRWSDKIDDCGNQPHCYVRPTHMIRSRRLALAAAVVALGLAACGDPNTTTPVAEQPPVIHLAGQNGGGFSPAPAAASAEAAADTKIAFAAPTEFVYDGDFPDLGSSAGSWFFDPNEQPDLRRIAALAASLGVQGDVRVVPADQGGGWAVGPEDYSAPVLTVSADGMHSCYLSSAPGTNVGFACGSGVATVSGEVAPVAAAAPEATSAPADSGVDTAAPDVPTSEPVVLPECPTPAPPVGVPTKDEAIAKAKQLFTDWGYDVNAYQFDDVYADKYGASVSAYLTLDGMRAPVILSVGFGENASVTFASGYLGQPQRGADYPTVGAAAGLERLNKQQDQFIGLGNSRAISSAGGVAVAEPAIAVAPCAPEAAASDACAAVDNSQPVTVHLNSVKADLTMIWDAGNTIWLLPAYTFGTADGGLYTVVAVDDAFIQRPDPVTPSTDPAVVNTGVPVPAIEPPVAVTGTAGCASFDAAVTVPPAPIEQIADAVVGKCLADAEALAKTFGYQVRVVRQDGVDRNITADLSEDRINVVVDGGVVTSVESIG